jgi:membrane-bound lytic murein transglycosylase MltF
MAIVPIIAPSLTTNFMNLKLVTLSIALAIVQPIYSQKYQGDSWAKVKTAGEGNLSVIYYEQPGLIQDVNGKPAGLIVDILQDFTEFVKTKYNKKVNIVYAGKEPIFTEFLLAAQNNNNILGVTNVTITEERKRILKFTPAFIANPVVMITHKDAPTLTDVTQIKKTFAGYSAEIIAGSTHVNHIIKLKKDYWPDLSIVYGRAGHEIIKKITTNSKLFTILDFTEFVNANRKKMPVKRQNVEFGAPEELAFVMSKQSDWDELWKEFLTEDYRKSAKYRKNIADNLGSAFLSILK